MPHYILASDVFLCEVDTGGIVIDLNRGKYFAIDSGCLEHVRRVATASATDDENAATHLENLKTCLDAGEILGNEELRCHLIDLRVTTPTDAVAPGWTKRTIHSGLSHMATFLSCYGRAKRAVKYDRIREIVQDLRFSKSTMRVPAMEARAQDAIDLVMLFRRLRLWTYTARDACLLDSLVLAGFLTKYGVRSFLVFGVKTKPFGAHAWVQLDAVVLNDTVENVQEYTPIFAV